MLANAAVAVVALLHVYFLVLEMFLWDKPFGRRTFGLTPEYAAASKTLAANQGLYNGFLAAGLAWGLALGPIGEPVQIFFLACVICAGVFGAFTVSRKIFWVQAVPALVALALVLMPSARAQSLTPQKVEATGITPQVKAEEVISGHLTELNGKFKLRVTEVTFEPGAHLGAHHHAGPGMRYVVSGTLTFVQAGKATLYQAGDSFYESGNVVHTAHNKTSSPVRLMFFEVLPADWAGPSVIVPKL